MEVEGIIKEALKEEGLQLLSTPVEGFLLPSATDIALEDVKVSFLGKSISKGMGGSIRDLIFLTLFLKSLAKEVSVFGEKRWKVFRFSSVGEANIECEERVIKNLLKTPVETPLGVVKANNLIIGKGRKTLHYDYERKEKKALPRIKPFSFLEEPYAVAFASNSVEGNLYFSEKKDNLNLCLGCVTFIINKGKVWTWERKELNLSSQPLVALAQGRKIIEGNYGGIEDGVKIPWPGILINPKWMKKVGETLSTAERFSVMERAEWMEKAKNLGVYMLNAGGDVKYYIDEKKRREDIFGKEIIVGKDFMEFLKYEKLKEGVDFVISGEEIIMKLGVLLALSLKRIFAKTFTIRLSYDEKGMKVKEELGVVLRTATFYREKAKPGDIIVKGKFVDKHRLMIEEMKVFEGGREYINMLSQKIDGDLFIGNRWFFKVERFADRVVFFPEEEEI